MNFLVLQAAVPQIIANTEEIFFNKTIDNLRHTADICCTEIKDIPCIFCPYRPEGSMAMMVRNWGFINLWFFGRRINVLIGELIYYLFLNEMQVKLNLSLLEDISDDIDFCFKLAKEESVIILPGTALFGILASPIWRVISFIQKNKFISLSFRHYIHETDFKLLCWVLCVA